MRLLVLLTLLLVTAFSSMAQLKNTKWQGKMNVPEETAVILGFKKDSLDMIIVAQGQVAESMTYSVKDSVITIKKTSGLSPCSETDECKVKFLIRDDKLFLSNLSDPCDARAQAWSSEPLVRMKE